jgi:hypothetical protein
MSKRMGLEKQQKENIKRNRLSGLAGPVFFFPLLVGWWEGAQGRIKYCFLFVSRFAIICHVLFTAIFP